MNILNRYSLLGIILAFFLALSSQAQTEVNATVTTTSSCKSDGTLTITVTSGTGPYYYSITRAGEEIGQQGDPLTNYFGTDTQISYGDKVFQVGPLSSSTYTFTNLEDGPYRVLVYTIGNGGYEENWHDVTVAPAFNTTLTFTNADCNGLNGVIAATPSGGTAPYTYLWKDGSTNASVVINTSKWSNVVVTDASGCQFHSIDSLYTVQNYTYELETSVTNANCTANGTATVSVLNGDPARTYTYSWNSIPLQSTATAINLAANENYLVTVTDDKGCQRQAYAYISQPNAFNLSLSATSAHCQQTDGAITATPTSGTAPFTYLWSTGATAPSITNLAGNTYYSVTAKDNNGCESTTGLFLNADSPVLIGFNVSQGTCGNSDASITATASNGTAPYTYFWNGTTPTSNAITNLSPGGYVLHVSDVNGCTASGTVYIDQDSICAAHLLGNVYYDVNQNGIQDTNEPGIATTITATNSSNISRSFFEYNANTGEYDFALTPDNYDVTIDIPAHWKIANGSSAHLSINATTHGHQYLNNNFGLVPAEEVSDVAVSVFTGSQRPGYVHYATITYNNLGTRQENGSIVYTVSDGWNIYSASPMPYSIDAETGIATWYYNDLNPLESRSISLYMYVPFDVALGTEVTGNAVIATNNSDIDLSNNQSSCSTIIQNSYDPNNLQVSPQGTGSEGYITEAQDELTYKIEFQNTGTAVAYDILVTNAIDNNLDASTLSVVSSSSPCTTTIENGTLNFSFRSINLPDSNHNEPASHGYVIYKVRRKVDLAPETKILNTANIYFDYNTAVATNQVQNTIARTTASVSAEQTNQDVVLFPNPSNNLFSIRFNAQEESKASVQLYSATGQEISLADDLATTAGNNSIQLDLAPYNLNNGLYIVKLVVGAKSYTRNLVVNH